MKVVLISCVKVKATEQCKAKDMYQSQWFKKAYAYAKKQIADKILILSAKYHVLEEDAVIEPYDLTLNKMTAAERRDWSQKVLEQLRALTDLDNDEVIILAGENYRKGIVGALKHVEIPMENLGVGQQLKFLTKELES